MDTIQVQEPAEPLTKVQRTVEILRILNEHELFSLIRRINQAPRANGGLGAPEIMVPPDVPLKVRRLLEALGPTFIKVGQLLGTRPDLIPKAFCDEFRNLYDRTTPTPFPFVKELLEREHGRPLTETFASFEPVPVASASIGQVHFATLQTGERVAVKVQHPGIRERVALDFQILQPIVKFIERVFAGSRVWQPEQHLAEVRQMLEQELDYTFEARNHQQVWRNFADEPNVKIPKIHWAFSTSRVLVLEYIDGIKVGELETAGATLDGTSLARIITHAMAKQIFEDRVFHADPSPGNLLILDSNTIAFLDFGAVGRVTRRRSERVLGLIVGFLRDDIEMVSQSLIDLCSHEGPFDEAAFQKDLEKIMEYHETRRASPGDPVMLDLIVTVARQHGMLLPADFMLITRALFQFEGMCRRLDPDYELVEVLGPYIKEVLYRRYTSPSRQKEAIVDMGIQFVELAKHLPGRTTSILRKLEAGEFRVKVDNAADARLERHREGQMNRAAATALATAAILGAAGLLALGQAEEIPRYTFLVALVILLWAFTMLLMKPGGK